MKNLSFMMLTLAVCCLSFQGTTSSKEVMTISKNELQQSKLLDFYLSDIYSQDVNFVKFTPIATTEKRRAATSHVYKSEDSRYKDWVITYYPNNTTNQQWAVKEPSTTTRAPIAGAGNSPKYCVTVRCFCESWGYYVVSCYSKCTEDDCCRMFLDFKRC